MSVDVEQAYRRYFPIIREKCARMLGDRAEAQDVAQETFTRLWSERARLRDIDARASWSYRTSTRLAVDRYRQASRYDELSSGDDVSAVVDAAQHLQTRRMLAQIAHRIPAAELEVAILSRIDGLSQPEIARV